MSQVEHRRRLRELKEREAAHANGLTSFIPQATPVTGGDDAQPVNVVQPPLPVPAPSGIQPILPVGASTVGMSPIQLRDQAKRVAELLAGMPQAEYEASLGSLERENPTLYGIVVDELNNLAATANGEDDGYDLSGLAAGTQATAVVEPPQEAPPTPVPESPPAPPQSDDAEVPPNPEQDATDTQERFQ